MGDDIEREGETTPTNTGEGALAELEAQLAAAREEARQNHDRWVRERADLENLKRRTVRERSEAARFGTESLVRELLAVVDNLDRAVQAAGAGAGEGALLDGVRMVLKGLTDALERQGVTTVEAAGAVFDPSLHEAVAHVESDAHAPNTVMAEHQRGYRMHDRLLRPALVTVAKTPAAATETVAKEGGGD